MRREKMEEKRKGRNGGHENGWRRGQGTAIAQDRTLQCHLVSLCHFVVQTPIFGKSGFLVAARTEWHSSIPSTRYFSVSTFCVAASLLSSLHQIAFIKWKARNHCLSQKPTLTLQVRTCHAGLSSVFHQAEREKGDYVLVMRLIQFIPVLQSTPNSQSSHNCSFRLSQTKRCCWIQVSFLNQIKILCDLHNLFNTDPHHDPSFTSPFFCQQKNVSSLKTDLPRETIRQPASVRVERECISEL